FALGTTVVTWTVTDGSGNTATCNQNVTVIDNQLPTITCKENQTRNADQGACTYTVNDTEFDPATINDNCTGTVVVNDYNNLGTLSNAVFQKGITTVTWTVTDGSGNTASCSFTVTVQDAENPSITCPQDIEQLTDPGHCSAAVTVPQPLFSDNCPGSYLINSFTETSNASGTYPSGTTTVTWTVFDSAGNSNICQQNIRIISYPGSMDDVASLMEDMTVDIPVLANDTDCDNNIVVSSLTIVQAPANGSATIHPGGIIHYVPVLNYYGTDTFTYMVCDADALCDTATVTITVNPVNDPPVTYNENISLCENTNTSGNILENGDEDEVEHTSLTVTTQPLSGPSHGTFELQGNGDFLYTPYAHYFGPDMVVISLCDNGYPLPAACTNDTVFINVMEAITAQAGEDQELCDANSTLLSVSDPNPGTSNWSQLSGPNIAVIHPANSPVATVSNMIPGTYQFVYTVITGECATWDTMMVVNHYHQAAYTGPDVLICENDTVNLTAATAQYQTSLHWSTTGNGTFSNPTLLNPVYYPGAQDITNGDVRLILTAYGSSPCTPVTDTMLVTIQGAAQAWAGPDATTCEGTSFTVTGAVAGNYNSIMWTHNGQGTINNPTAISPTYVPATNESGTVTLTLTVTGISPCGGATDEMQLQITPYPEGGAGANASICEGESYTVSDAWAVNANAILWTHNGQGTLINANSLTPTYIPAPGEVDTVELAMRIFGYSPCGEVMDSKHLFINPAPAVNAGSDIETCGSTPVELASSDGNGYSSLLWHTSGTGSFNDSTILHPVYYPSQQDVQSGEITLTLVAHGIGTCSDAADALILSLTKPASVNAGDDKVQCVDNQVVVNDATAENYKYLIWTHNGAGTLTGDTTLHPTYIPLPGETGEVTLVLKVFAHAPCDSIVDEKVLTFHPAPQISAGPDQMICEDENLLITEASGQHYEDVFWSTTGTGAFDNHLLLNPVYHPSQADIEQGKVSLILTATPLGGCLPISDTLMVTISGKPSVEAGPDLSVCAGTTIHLNSATAANYSAVSWSANGILLNNNPDSLAVTYKTPSGMAGDMVMNITVSGIGGCADRTASDSLVLTLNGAPMVNAGPDLSTQPGTSVVIDATVSSGSGVYGYQWAPAQYLVNPDVEDPTTVPVNENVTLVLTALDLVTGCAASDSVNINVGVAHLAPVAVDDYAQTIADIPVLIHPMNNDYDPEGTTLHYFILEGPHHGSVSSTDDSSFTYIPDKDYQGIDSIRYFIQDSDSLPQTDTAMIYITIGEGVPIEIYNVITPNGDGVNDTWTISGIEKYPENSVIIFNRWGDKIRTFNGYNNSDVIWDGTNKNGESVPDGTYFYIIKLEHVGSYQGWVFVRGSF
ncbi:MAG TPA: Ig-like domain-containing protein, partial [Bacteroidales bacterium]|nr:Ig-like domain-containing protein [Bacteroidales bacterium]